MTDMTDVAFYLMMGFYVLLTLAAIVTICGLPAILRSFDAELAKNQNPA